MIISVSMVWDTLARRGEIKKEGRQSVKKPENIAFECVAEIDVSKIPEHVRMNLGEAIYKGLLEDSKRPGFWEGFERWKAERQAKGTAKHNDGQ